jgi:ribosomal-protein-alanine N-acetyltransferase
MRDDGSSDSEQGPLGEQPRIATGTLTLRPWQESDALQVMKAFSDPDIREWHMIQLDDKGRAEKWIEQWHEKWRLGTAAAWAITDSSAPENVRGQVAFRALYLDDGMAEISYWVLPDYRGEGIAAQATHALSEWGFRQLGLYRLEIAHSVRNRRSCNVARKAGFQPEGIKRSLQRYEQGGFHDMHLHARVQPAETPARAWDRAALGIVSHVRLWTAALLISATSALLALVYRYAAVIPLVIIAGVLVLRVNLVYWPSRKHFRARPMRTESRQALKQ